MAERSPAEARAVDSGPSQLDTFLTNYVGSKPGVRFGELTQAAQVACQVSRGTAARHLARLVRYGDLTLLPDRTYLVGGPSASDLRPVLEIRWFEGTVTVHPDGSARVAFHREFRVISGQLDFFTFFSPKPPRQFVWWCTAASHATRIPDIRSQSREFTYRIEFEPPLSSRNAKWQRMHIDVELPTWYRMSRAPSREPGNAMPPGDAGWEAESIEVEAQARSYAQRVAPDAHLRLQVVLPPGYPSGRLRGRVSFQNKPSRTDPVEEARLAALELDRRGQGGLRRAGDAFTLSIPRPRLDRRYELHWALPTALQRTRWLARRAPR
ncbi:MAG: hypothetical protein L3K17_05325 [Thermoplasmata archaeon]|nr:hypothetical protein [Thermoplasmata archaeon]